jgi:polar amino acid transport system substrate-binding protein
MCRAALLAAALAGLPWAAHADAALRMVIDSATHMPMARIERDAVSAGMTLELGQLLAQQLGRDLQVLARPRKRLLQSLESGEAHIACSYMPAWLPGSLQWSQGFFRHDEVLVSRQDAKRPVRLEALRGQRIGTILGFVYPGYSAALGNAFVREDAPNAEANLRKLAAGRIEHAAVSARLLSYQQRTGAFSAAIHPPLLTATLLTHCALGPAAPVSLQALDAAIAAIQRGGSLERLYRRYAPTEAKTRSNSSP